MSKSKEKQKEWVLRNKEHLREYQKQFRLRNLEYYREKQRQWRLAHPEKHKENHRKHYQKHREVFKLKQRQRRIDNPEAIRARDRLQYRKRVGIVGATDEQKHGICPICNTHRKLVCDHDHATGLIRGWICGWCNVNLDWAVKYGDEAKKYISGAAARPAMKILTTILLLCGLSFGQSTELLRPTTDVNTGSSAWVTNNCGIGTYFNNSTSGSLARDTGGLSTSVSYSISATGALRSTARTWMSWSSTSNSYTALTLNVSASSPGSSGGGTAKVVYSTDGGSTYTLLSTPGIAQSTTTITLSATQNLSNLRVAACVSTTTSDPGTGNNTVIVYDIWTSGSLAAAPAGSGSGSGTAVQPVQFN